MVIGCRWPRHVDLLARLLLRRLGGGHALALLLQFRLQPVAELVQRVADVLLLLPRHFLQAREESGDEPSLPSEVPDAQVVELVQARGPGEESIEVGGGFSDFVEHVVSAGAALPRRGAGTFRHGLDDRTEQVIYGFGGLENVSNVGVKDDRDNRLTFQAFREAVRPHPLEVEIVLAAKLVGFFRR